MGLGHALNIRQSRSHLSSKPGRQKPQLRLVPAQFMFMCASVIFLTGFVFTKGVSQKRK
jgi:hypothetical protein